MDDEPMQYSYTQLSIRPSLGHLRLQKCMMVMAEMLMSKLQNGGSRISKLPHGYPLVWSFIYLCLYLSAGDTIWIFVIKRTKILFVVKVKQAEKKKHKERLLGTTALLESYCYNDNVCILCTTQTIASFKVHCYLQDEFYTALANWKLE